MLYKQIFSGIAIALTFIALVPYIFDILRGKIRPHVFSWIVWGSTTFVVFLAQLRANGGIGAWPIGVSGILTILIAILAFAKRADISITKTDWLFFLTALSALPFWYLTANPLYAVVILTTVDILGFGPTLRKAYDTPNSESVGFFALFAIRNSLVILALEHYSLTTVLFPAAIAAASVLVMAIISIRRLSLA